MSHVADIDLEINDLGALKEAGKCLGLELVKQSTYRWFGQHVGDYPLPKGFTTADLGKCDYVLRIPNNDVAYEIGLVKRKDGKGYQPLWDFWAGGKGLEAKVGKDAERLIHEYTIALSTKELRREGFRVSRSVHPVTKKPVLVARRGV